MFVLCSCCIYHVPMHWIRVVSVVTNIGEMHVICIQPGAHIMCNSLSTYIWHACVLEGLDRMVHTSGMCIGKIAAPYGSRIDAQTQLLACGMHSQGWNVRNHNYTSRVYATYKSSPHTYRARTAHYCLLSSCTCFVHVAKYQGAAYMLHTSAGYAHN